MSDQAITTGFDPRELRHALGRFATGITVVTTLTPAHKREGLTANSFAALSLDPPLVLWSLNRKAKSLASFERSERFAVNVLAAHQRHISNHFAMPQPDKFAHLAWQPGLGGCPTLPDCLALFECRLERTVAGGDHVLFIGRVERFRWRAGEPLLFSCGQYCIAAALPDDLEGERAPSDFSDLLL
jgi:flavin reductase (DIM6/NTAB) family NADH-FMN oxidoreductase RutF